MMISMTRVRQMVARIKPSTNPDYVLIAEGVFVLAVGRLMWQLNLGRFTFLCADTARLRGRSLK